MKPGFYILIAFFFILSCNKNNNEQPVTGPFQLKESSLNHMQGSSFKGVNTLPVFRYTFNDAVNRSSVQTGIKLTALSGGSIPFTVNYANQDSTLIIQPASSLSNLSRYTITVGTSLRSIKNIGLSQEASMSFLTAIDSSDKFPQLTDSALLTLVQQQTFKYFWDFGHPVSGMARERNTSGETVTTGGTGFGVMAILTGIHRSFITRSQGLTRVQTIVSFLKNSAQKFHGAFPHWMNGSNGTVIPFSQKDNGADLVETSFLIQGLLCARQFFNGTDAAETSLRNDINAIWQGVEWNWFRKNNENVLYWHWSPNYGWDINLPIRGWNECLITYVLAASSPTHPITKPVYDQGWAQNGAMMNGNSYYGFQLPLGPPLGGPLFFEHYSFLGINPDGLIDAYATYETQTTNHTKINHAYCKANPKGYYGYSDSCWGLTASDIPGSYTASSPTNDVGVIAPTAALSSFPYTPVESMKALKFFYYKLGDKLWGPHGFYDAFSLDQAWFSNSYLAIDQGPIIVMMENHRTGLLWNLFMSSPEIKSGMQTLGFQSPHL